MPYNEAEGPTPMVEVFVGLHEMYLAAREGGFERDEALYIVSKFFLASMNNGQSPEEPQ